MRLISLLILIFSIIMFGSDKQADEELVKRTEEWFRNNPGTTPHWMTPEELERIDEIGKDFIETDPPAGPVRQTAEFERMQGVLISAHSGTQTYGFGIPFDLIQAMSTHTTVYTIVSSDFKQNAVNDFISAGIDTSKCEFVTETADSYWTRDFGPLYVADGNNELGVVDFIYNRPREYDDAVPSVMAPYLEEPYYGMSVVHTGGNYMTDGMGVAASSDIVYSESYSTLGISEQEVDQRMNDYLGIHTYHVVEDPNNTYIDHIDCWGKFLDVDKILIREVPESHPQYEELENTAAYFASQRSSYGNYYQIYRVFTPNDEPYTNSLILNDHVYVPVTGGENDSAALSLYQNIMPGYTVSGMSGSWESTDALHCRTRGVADKEMLHIYHVAKVFDQSPGYPCEISADIVSYGGHSITGADLYYRVNSGFWTSVPMSSVKGSYTASIPQQTGGTEVQYYIRAQDASGRIETHPFIGAADPHDFMFDYNPDITLSQTDTLSASCATGSSVNSSFDINNTGDADLSYTLSFEYIGEKDTLILHENNFDTFPGTGYTNTNFTDGGGYAYLEGVKGGITGVLTSPSFSTSGYSGLTLNFDETKNFGTGNSTINVEYFTGTEWTGIYTSSQSGTGNINLELPVASAQTQIRFTAYCDKTVGAGGTADYYSLDNIIVSTEYSTDSWLSINSPLSGSVAPSNSSTTDMTFDASGLDYGNYYADITVSSNDPDEPQLVLPVKLTVSDALSAPSNLVVVNATSSQIDLSWDAVSGAGLYRIYRSTDPYGGFTEIDTSGTESYSDTGVSANNKYFYYITADNVKN